MTCGALITSQELGWQCWEFSKAILDNCVDWCFIHFPCTPNEALNKTPTLY